jgi:hypothetical protein
MPMGWNLPRGSLSCKIMRSSFRFPQVPLDKITARVEEVRFLNRTTAAVRYTILIPGYAIPKFSDRIGRVVLDDGTSKATRETACADLALGGVTCPAR